MRSLVALAALAVADAGKKAKGEYSWDQAKCLFKKRKIVFLGDSNTRFFSFQFATFLEKGEYRSDDYDKWGEPGDDYDKEYEDETWTDWSRKSKKSATHAQHLVKTYDDLDSRHTFFFLQKTWFGDETTKEENMDDIAAKVKKDKVDIVVMNSGWWDLKGWGEKDYDDCGEDWEDDCGDAYERDAARFDPTSICARDVKKAADEIFSGAKAAVWRDCSCCGDETSHEKSVKRLNAIAKDVMDDRGYPVAEIFDLYGKKDLDDATVDGTHATPEYYHAWTMKIMTGVEAQLKTGCLGDSYEDDEPASCPGLEAVASDGCPADADLVTCDDASLQPGDLCEGDGECGTDKKLNNCPDGTAARGRVYEGYGCTTWNGLLARCRDDADWRAAQYCRFSCDELGVGYDGFTCAAPSPTPAPSTPAPTARNCPVLEAISSNACPDDAPRSACDAAGLLPGDFCSGDGECATDEALDNCGAADVRAAQGSNPMKRTAAPARANPVKAGALAEEAPPEEDDDVRRLRELRSRRDEPWVASRATPPGRTPGRTPRLSVSGADNGYREDLARLAQLQRSANRGRRAPPRVEETEEDDDASRLRNLTERRAPRARAPPPRSAPRAARRPARDASLFRREGAWASLRRSSSRRRADRIQTYATAVDAFPAGFAGELDLVPGDRITILDSNDDEWWRGETPDGAVGVFPCSHIDNVSADPRG
ncbi:hypothetical protein JL720_1716 [Aureococcus anophagefferens]|nr:hypothetical protein JL720_1716 [Aureococcus anophagefferens]